MRPNMAYALSISIILALLASTAAGQDAKSEDLFSASARGSLPAAVELRPGDIDIVSVNAELLRSGGASGAALNLRFQKGAYEFRAIRTSLAQSLGGASVWRGQVRDGGSALFTSRDGKVHGRIETNKGVFLLRPIPGARQHRIISTASWKSFTASEPDVLIPEFPAEAMAGATHEEKSDEASPSQAPQADVLILYNAEFREAHGGADGARARIDYLVELANQSYINSGINFSIRLVHTSEVEYPNVLPAADALSDLTKNKNGLEQVGDLRDKYGADFVILMRDLTREHVYAGIAWFLDERFRGAVHLFKEYAFAVVGDGEFISGGRTYYAEETTLAHEIGHIMGNEHDRANAGSLQPLHRNAYGYHLADRYRTVMSYPLSDSEENIPYFSNPGVKYDGIPTGDKENNCALSMNNIASKVVQWRRKRIADNGKDFLDVEDPWIISARIVGHHKTKITDSADINITFLAADNTDIVAYRLVERSRRNTEDDQWQSVKPTKRLKIRRYPFRLSDSNRRVRRIFLYVKDAAGNVSEKERLKIRYIKNDGAN